MYMTAARTVPTTTLCNALRGVLLAAVAAALAGCATGGPTHESQTAPDADLGQYQTFAVQGASGGTADQPLRLLDANIRNAISHEMQQRGYTETKDKPQLLVTWDNSSRDKVKSNPFRIGIGLGSFGSNVGGSVNVGSPSVQSYKEGLLVIHVLDAAANRELWFGSIASKVDRSSLDAEAVGRVVAQAMEGFPARAATPTPASAPAPAQ